MAQASRDQNSVPSLLGASSADGVTPVAIFADPITHELVIGMGNGNHPAKSIAARDQNFVSTLIAVSSADGVTPVAVYANPSTNALFVKT